jgi:hypothetical protein
MRAAARRQLGGDRDGAGAGGELPGRQRRLEVLEAVEVAQRRQQPDLQAAGRRPAQGHLQRRVGAHRHAHEQLRVGRLGGHQVVAAVGRRAEHHVDAVEQRERGRVGGAGDVGGVGPDDRHPLGAAVQQSGQARGETVAEVAGDLGSSENPGASRRIRRRAVAGVKHSHGAASTAATTSTVSASMAASARAAAAMPTEAARRVLASPATGALAITATARAELAASLTGWPPRARPPRPALAG